MSFYREILANRDAPFLVRRDAAEKLLPYAHPKLTSIEARSGGTTHEERLAMYRQMLADVED
jgi:hypothetical protein